MTDRERLLEILNVPIYPHENVDPLEAVADYLIDNGVKIPVLCKDCKHWAKSGQGCGYCKAWEQGRVQDHYCSCGEKRSS